MKIDITNISKILGKLKTKNPSTFKALQKKIIQIAKMNEVEIFHLKNLKGPMSHLKRVHVGSFVLTFSIEGDKVVFKDFTHHDQAY